MSAVDDRALWGVEALQGVAALGVGQHALRMTRRGAPMTVTYTVTDTVPPPDAE